MRKIIGTLGVLGLAGVGLALPTSSAHAATNCDTKYNNASWGYVYLYDKTNCRTFLGKDANNDSDYSASWGKASSVLNKGTYSNGYNVVKFYDGAGYDMGHSCLKQSEYYVDNLGRNTFTSYQGEKYNVNNSIDSHKWVKKGSCSKFMS
ncbi:hypothetical protein P8605_40135 [Streptomyces sp. T-3]|nr:hypothetical protein [Streptomyces sp. T-3]